MLQSLINPISDSWFAVHLCIVLWHLIPYTFRLCMGHALITLNKKLKNKTTEMKYKLNPLYLKWMKFNDTCLFVRGRDYGAKFLINLDNILDKSNNWKCHWVCDHKLSNRRTGCSLNACMIKYIQLESKYAKMNEITHNLYNLFCFFCF
jgi:hypothetical protein